MPYQLLLLHIEAATRKKGGKFVVTDFGIDFGGRGPGVGLFTTDGSKNQLHKAISATSNGKSVKTTWGSKLQKD